MEGLTTNMQSLVINQSTPYESTGRFNLYQTDPAHLLDGSSLKTLTYTEYASMPVLHSTYTFNGQESNTTAIFFYFQNLVTAAPDIFRKYRFVRCDLELTFEINASWNHVGLFGIYWSTNMNEVSRHLLYSTTGTEGAESSYNIWYIPPTQREFVRVGQTTTKTVTVPWIHSMPFYDTGKTSEEYIPPIQNPLMVDQAISPFPEVRFYMVTPLRTIPNGIVPITVNVYRKLVNVQVGGFIGSDSPVTT